MSWMSTYVSVEISPDTTTRPVFTSVSHATRPYGSSRSTASSTPSEIWSAILSGCPSVTDSEVNRNSCSESIVRDDTGRSDRPRKRAPSVGGGPGAAVAARGDHQPRVGGDRVRLGRDREPQGPQTADVLRERGVRGVLREPLPLAQAHEPREVEVRLQRDLV